MLGGYSVWPARIAGFGGTKNWNWNWNIGLFFKELGLEVLSKSQELGNTDFILLLLYKAKKEEKQQSPKH